MRTEPSFSVEAESRLSDDIHHTQSDFNFPSNVDDELSLQRLSDYQQRYGLSVDPFVDDHHFPFYTGAQRRKILDQLLHLCQFSNNVLVVTSDYGAGKTRMAQALIDSLDDADDICFLEAQASSTFESLYADMIEQFGIKDPSFFPNFIIKQQSENGIAVLIIDNAHYLSDPLLLRLMDLIQFGAELRLHVVFFAEPELLLHFQRIDTPNIVVTDFSLEKFTLNEAVDYLNFRMEMADYLGPELFTESNVDSWWRESQGSLVILHEYAKEKLLQQALAPRTFGFNRKTLPLPHIVGASVLVAVLLMSFLYWHGESATPKPATMISAIPLPSPSAAIKVSELPSQVQKVSQESAAPVSSITIVSPSVPASLPNETTTTAIKTAQPVVNVASAANTSVQKAIVDTPYVRQSVVPLVQTNAVPVKAALEVVKPVNISAAKEIKKNVVVQEVVKSVSKVETKSIEKIKSIAGKPNFSDQEKTILSWGEADFTLQIVGLSSEKAVSDFVEQQPNKKELLVFKSVRQGKSWFVVVAGRYSSAAKARKAAQLLPEMQKKAVPWPREIKIIQNEIKQR